MRMKYGLSQVVMIVGLLHCAQSIATSASAALQSKLNAMRTLSADFHQVVRAKKKVVSRSSGTMALSRPGHFRWQTKTPMAQWVIADGQHLWVYDVDLEQVTVKKQDKHLGGTAALFLSESDESVAREFEVTSHQAGKKTIFELQSRQHKANFEQVTLQFVGEVLEEIIMVDQLGQHTEVRLQDIKMNPILRQTLFQFKPPKGIDVVAQ